MFSGVTCARAGPGRGNKNLSANHPAPRDLRRLRSLIAARYSRASFFFFFGFFVVCSIFSFVGVFCLCVRGIFPRLHCPFFASESAVFRGICCSPVPRKTISARGFLFSYLFYLDVFALTYDLVDFSYVLVYVAEEWPLVVRSRAFRGRCCARFRFFCFYDVIDMIVIPFVRCLFGADLFAVTQV